MLKLAIQTLLEKRAITTAAFAAGAQIAPNTALALRRGTTQRIDMVTLEKVCRFLQIKPGQAFLYEPDPPSTNG